MNVGALEGQHSSNTISIVTITYNSGIKLRSTFKSIPKKKENIEYIVIDGGSSDNTREILLASDIVDLFVIEKDSGISDAFNKGIKHSANKYILFLNSGDLLLDESLDIYFSAIEKWPDVDVFYGDLKYVPQDNVHAYVETPNINNIWKFMSIYHPGMLIKKSAYEKIGGYDLNYKYAMDSEWVHRAINAKLKFHYIPHVLANMQLGGKSDKYFYFSLFEFCRSSMKYRPNKLLPLFYLIRQLLVHSLLRIPLIKKWRLKRV
jgi:glycosyltransferase involved in cell wall biosynthesis